MRKTVDYFVNKKSTVIMCSLDMEKAFDKVNRDALFIKMMRRGCPLTLINILDGWFEKSFSCVRWDRHNSEQFALLAGTRQGGVLSPLLFSIYIDDILIKLDESNCGCVINNISFNSFLYADDMVLLSLSLRDMMIMLDVCRRELAWLDMSLNLKKSCAVRIGDRWGVPIAPLSVGGTPIPWVTKIRYLGVDILSAKCFSICLHGAKIKFFQSLNAILGKIGDVNAIPLILSLTATNCNPVLMYGLDACLLTL